jgi:non-heme chloroperoxidase
LTNHNWRGTTDGLILLKIIYYQERNFTKRNIVSISVFLLFVLLHHADAPSQTWIDPSPHRVQFITVEPSVRLEVLDWGGKGKTIVFLAGLKNTAHIFDEFAPQFTDSYHVIGITRRGFGASSQPMSKSLQTWVDDIRVVLDSLKISRAIFIGHSIAGIELTKFASMYPSRIEKLVYLDAAYDYVEMLKSTTEYPSPPAAIAFDSSSIEHFQEYNIRVLHECRYPQAEWYNILKLSPDGHIIGDVTPRSVRWGIFDSLEHPAYDKIKSPVLAIFANYENVRKMFPYIDLLDSINKVKAANAFKVDSTFCEKNLSQFKNTVRINKVILLTNAKHEVFLSNPKETAIAIRKFLRASQ